MVWIGKRRREQQVRENKLIVQKFAVAYTPHLNGAQIDTPWAVSVAYTLQHLVVTFLNTKN